MPDPYYTDPRATLWQGDCGAVLRGLPAKSVHCVVTSPPYLGLRSYAGEQEQVWGGDPECAHEWGEPIIKKADGGPPESMRLLGGKATTQDGARFTASSAFCPCGAWRGALGLEPSIGLYVRHIVEVMAEVRRVLRDDGTVWLNCGDSYTSHSGYSADAPSKIAGSIQSKAASRYVENGESTRNPKRYAAAGLPEKNLMMIPARVAIALQDDGWVLRSDIAWCKTSAMPESVTDRPSSAWEHIFLLAKQGRYFYDAEAVRQKFADERMGNPGTNGTRRYAPGDRQDVGRPMAWERGPELGGANLRNFWLLGPEPFPEAHFATFPTEIPRRAILAGTSAHGACAACGAPWRRVVEREFVPTQDPRFPKGGQKGMDASNGWGNVPRGRISADTLGWQPTCDHEAPIVPATIFDPFAGSGTTLMVARALGRIGWGAELSAEYCRMAVKRIQGQTPAMALDA